MNVSRKCKTIGLALMGLVLLAIPAVADTASNCGTCDLSGVDLYASGGDITVYFVGQTAAYTSTVSLVSPSYSGEMLNNHTSSYGDSVDLGTFAAGTHLVFRLYVYNTGDTWFTGPALSNYDGIVHAGIKHWDGLGAVPEGTFVGFEDLPGGGDRDYDDHMWVFTNTRTTPQGDVPEPASLFLLGTGLIGAARRGRKWLDR